MSVWCVKYSIAKKGKVSWTLEKFGFKVDKSCCIDGTYEEFENFIEKRSNQVVVQMDSIIIGKCEKCLLTVHFVDSSVILAFLREFYV